MHKLPEPRATKPLNRLPLAMKSTFPALIVSTTLLLSRRPAQGATMIPAPAGPDAASPPLGDWTEAESTLFDDPPRSEATDAAPAAGQDELLAKKKKKKKKTRRS